MTVNAYNSITSTSDLHLGETRGSRASRSTTVSDKTSLSSSAQTQQLQDSLDSLPEVRTGRVAAAQSTLSNGGWSSGQIAGAMWSELRAAA